MTSEHRQWQEIKASYLKLIEKNLAQVDHPRRAEILDNVREHLDNKFAELPQQQKNWEGYQQIITEMGPPEEYAELLAENHTPKAKTTSGINTFLAFLFVIVLAAVGGYLIYTAKEGTPPEGDPVIYVNDLPVDGIVIGQPNCTADFVQSLIGLPARIDYDGKMLRYTDHGFDLWFSGNKHLSEIHLNQGFTGKLDTGISMASSKQDVLEAYGKPIQTIQADNLHSRNDDRILYQKGNASRIYYSSYGLIFWFKDDAINQIVPFKGRMEGSGSASIAFEPDERVPGQWVTVDFVKSIEDFDPTRKNLQGELFLKELVFEDNGILWWTNKNSDPSNHRWTKGKVDPLDKRPAFYYLRNIDGQTYLFYEWISGDVTARGREPAYYVLKQVKEGETLVPAWFEDDPQAAGYWVSVDFVNTINDFQPNVQQTSDLFLKTLRFENNGRLWWTLSTSKPIALDWTRGKIRPFDVFPAAYSIKQLDKTDYLFYEYRTLNSKPAGYYVFKRSDSPQQVQKTTKIRFENDPQVLGQWTTVDFVETPDMFRPNQQSWQGPFWVRGLHFQEQGFVEWCLGQDLMKIKHRWTKGRLNPDDELPAGYFIERHDEGAYLFMEWNSGDVTLRGQKPAYYVLKKEE